MKLENVVSYAKAVKALFDKYKTPVVNYNKKLIDPFEATVLDVQIADVDTMLGTGVLKKLNKGDTANRNGYMDNESPILKDMEFKIGICRTDGTITDSVASFGLTAFRKGINEHNIDLFHTSYESTISRVNIAGNKAALIAVDFLQTNIDAITKNHDLAWDMNTTKINLKLDINSLSTANQVLVNKLLATCQQVIDSILAYAESISDKKLAKLATSKAILKSVVPTEPKKPRKRNIPAGSSILLRSNLVAKNILQMTLQTDVKVKVCRQVLKTAECTSGNDLTYKTMVELKKKEIIGDGEFVKLTNMDTTKKAVVLVFEVDVKKV